MEDNKGNVDQLLQEAALKGDVTLLADLVGKDPLLLHRPSKIRPLHIASRLGHLGPTEELLRLNPSLAEELDPTDMSSPLHLASGNGHVDVVRALVSANPCMCLARDAHGMNPALVAAMKGHVLVLGELLRAVPAASIERVGGGCRESILHLCVKYNQFEALKAVVAKTPAGDARMLLNAKDRDGNTILHKAMADQRVEIIDFLLGDERVERDMENKYGWTAKDILKENKKNVNAKISIITLRHGKAKLLSSKQITKRKEKEKRSCWFSDKRNSLMIVAALVATMAFQAALTPPFKYGKDDPPFFKYDKENNTDVYETAKLRDSIVHDQYLRFSTANTIGMVSSMSSLILLISGLPGRRFFVILVMMMMWVAVSSMAYTYVVLLENNSTELFFHLFDPETLDASPYNHDDKELEEPDHFGAAIFKICEKMRIIEAVWACGMAVILLWTLATWILKLFTRFHAWLGLG